MSKSFSPWTSLNAERNQGGVSVHWQVVSPTREVEQEMPPMALKMVVFHSLPWLLTCGVVVVVWSEQRENRKRRLRRKKDGACRARGKQPKVTRTSNSLHVGNLSLETVSMERSAGTLTSLTQMKWKLNAWTFLIMTKVWNKVINLLEISVFNNKLKFTPMLSTLSKSIKIGAAFQAICDLFGCFYDWNSGRGQGLLKIEIPYSLKKLTYQIQWLRWASFILKSLFHPTRNPHWVLQ